MIRWRYPLFSMLGFVTLSCAALQVDKEKLSALPNSAQSMQAQRKMREKLRQAVSLPGISAVMGYRVNYRGEFENMARATATSQIPEIEKELKGDATDAER